MIFLARLALILVAKEKGNKQRWRELCFQRSRKSQGGKTAEWFIFINQSKSSLSIELNLVEIRNDI